jgi:hypothetical protein
MTDPATDTQRVNDPAVIQTDPPVLFRAHSRGNRITITIPEEVNAIAELTGQEPGEVISRMITAKVDEAKATARLIFSGGAK